jgi:predicted metal-dependent hydrolase
MAADDVQLTLPLEPPSSAVPSFALRAAEGERAAEGDAVAARRLRRVMLGGQLCHFQLRRARRRTIGFQIDDQGLTVSAPRWVSLRAIEAAIVEKERWIRSKLVQWQDWRARHGSRRLHWADGAKVPYLGGELTLRLRPNGLDLRAGCVRNVHELQVALAPGASEPEIRALVQDWFRHEATRILGERVRLLSVRLPCKQFTWRLSSARTQWGSCNEDGRILLNWRLLFFPIAVIDYVVAHELAHLTELNHGPAFWREVERLLPDFQAARDQIKDEELGALPL